MSFAFAGIGLVVFFLVVLYFGVRSPWRDADLKQGSKIPLLRKSPWGRWRY